MQFPKTRLQVRVLFLIFLVFLPLIALFGWSIMQQRRAAVEASQRDALRIANIIAANQAQVIENGRHFLTALSEMPAVQNHVATACNPMFERLLTTYPNYTNIFSVDLDGFTRCSGLTLDGPVNSSDQVWLQTILASRDQFVVSDYMIGTVSRKPIVVLALPLFNQAGEFTGAIAVGLSLNWLNEFIANSNLPEDTTVLLLDNDNTMLAAYGEETILQAGDRYANQPVLAAMQSRNEGTTRAIGLDDIPRLYAFAALEPTLPRSHILLAISEPVAFANVRRVEITSLIIMILLIVAGLSSVWFSTRLITHPVSELVKVTHNLTHGALSTRVKITSNIEEIDQLASTFNTMAESLERRVEERTQALEVANQQLQVYTSQLKASNDNLQSFAYVASHDLQEPLRKIQTFGDRLLTKHLSSLAPEAQDYLKRMISASQRMQNLINGLLAFSRVETAKNTFMPVDLNKLINQVLLDLEPQIQQTGATVSCESMPTVPVTADGVQMQQVFQNLIGNALKYRRPDVPPVIRITCDESDRFYEIRVIDNGIGFEPEYKERIFALFERLHGRSEYEGTGIGLAIVRRIIERHHGSIVADSIPGNGSTFTIKLPRSQNQ